MFILKNEYKTFYVDNHILFAAPYEAISHDDDYSDVDHDEEFDEQYEYPSNISIDQQGSQSIICKCKVLYDFNSSMSSELTVREGKHAFSFFGQNDGEGMFCGVCIIRGILMKCFL